jgi:hypothetical protein
VLAKRTQSTQSVIVPADGTGAAVEKWDFGTIPRGQLSGTCYTTCPHARKVTIDVAFWHFAAQSKSAGMSAAGESGLCMVIAKLR